jgi:hypothetical protein
MTPHEGTREITVEVHPSKPGTATTKADVEQAIRRKLETEATELFVHGDTVILTVKNFGGKR